MTHSELAEVIETVRLLRSPEGCPWDQVQTHQTLTTHVIEEAYELAEAIDTADATRICDELGDVLLQVLLHSQIASDSKTFELKDVARVLNEKLIRRHPHVFGDTHVANAAEVVANWDSIKQGETREASSAVPKNLPALRRATKALRLINHGSSEPYAELAHAKLMLDEIQGNPTIAGKLLLLVADIVRHTGVDPEDELRKEVNVFLAGR